MPLQINNSHMVLKCLHPPTLHNHFRCYACAPRRSYPLRDEAHVECICYRERLFHTWYSEWKDTLFSLHTRGNCWQTVTTILSSFVFSPVISLVNMPEVQSVILWLFCMLSYIAAAQMWTLSIYLPLIIGDKVPYNEPLWECFLLLLDILQIVMARVLSPGLAAYLADLIYDHHSMFRRCYPSTTITPKMHYMVHLPSQILK